MPTNPHLGSDCKPLQLYEPANLVTWPTIFLYMKPLLLSNLLDAQTAISRKLFPQSC